LIATAEQVNCLAVTCLKVALFSRLLNLDSGVLKFIGHATTEKDVLLYPIIATRHYSSAVYAVIVCLSVRPSVCLFVTSRHCTKTAKRTAAPNTDGVGSNWQFLTNVSLYLRNGAR